MTKELKTTKELKMTKKELTKMQDMIRDCFYGLDSIEKFIPFFNNLEFSLEYKTALLAARKLYGTSEMLEVIF